MSLTPTIDFVATDKPHCRWCLSEDMFAVPPEGPVDKLCWAAWWGPFKCRVCHRKSYYRIRKLLDPE